MFKTRKPDLDGLREFADGAARGRAPFFVGRDDLIGRVEGVAKYSLEPHFTGATQLLVAGPGGGKTALLCRMEEMWRDGGSRTLLCNWEDLGTAELVGAILDRMAPRKARAFRRVFGDAATSARVKGDRGNDDKAVLAADRVVSGAWHWLKWKFPPKRWKRPLYLLVDDLHHLDWYTGALVRRLHQNIGNWPIVPVLAGLPHSLGVLDKCGIARLSIDAMQDFGPLGDGEPEAAVRQMLEHFRADAAAADVDRWAGVIAGLSDRWPPHLQIAMAALAEALAAAGGALAQVDAEAVTARVRARRTAAFEALLSPEMRGAAHLVAKYMAETEDDVEPIAWGADILSKVVRDADGWRLPDGMDAGDFMCHMRARGVLYQTHNHHAACSAPGLRRYLIEKAQLTPEP